VNKANETVDFKLAVSEAKLGELITATQFSGYDMHQTNEDQSMSLQPLDDVLIEAHQVTVNLEPLSWNMLRIKTEL
jgi:alpha-N-arabinofuranosidase